MKEETFQIFVKLFVAISALMFGIFFRDIANIITNNDAFLSFLNTAKNISKDYGPFIVGIAAFCAATGQAISSRTQNRRSVQPLITVDMELNSNNEIEANITNHGNGPAIFEEFMIEYESVRYQGADIEKPITIILSTFKVKGYFLYTYNPNGVLGPNQKKNILTVQIDEKQNPYIVMNKIDQKIRLLATYRSLLGEKFPYDTNDHDIVVK